VSLAQQLLYHLPDRGRGDESAIDELLASGVAEARRRWPDIAIDVTAYVAWIAARIPPEATSIADALRGLRLADLALTCACAAGDARALAAFDAAFIARAPGVSDDVKQALRAKLFVAEPGGEPRIARYGGRGELRRWVRAAAIRMGVDDARLNREVATEDALLSAIGIDPSHGPAVELLKKDSATILQAALHEAIAALSNRHRVLLLHYYIDGLGLVELGKLFGIAPSNVSRSLAKARVLLVSGIRRSLMRHKKIPPDELDSLVALVHSQLSVSGPLRDR
jgi:RNA polymerase sigma-70 factor (ECF subfamily)